MSNQLVWFKRDLRVADHAPLVEAAKRGPCLCLYVYEPEVFATAEHDASHLVFVNDSLAELRESLRERGGELAVRTGRMPDVLAELHAQHRFAAVWAHEETGQAVTYERDKRVARWCREQGVGFYEAPSGGVVRRLKSRDGWATLWKQRMQVPPLRAPDRVESVPGVEPGPLLGPEAHGLPPSEKTEAQRGGESLARETLRSFLSERGAHYRADMASPNEGWDGCSRISTHLAYGNLSVRQAHHATTRRASSVKTQLAEGRGDAAELRAWSESLRSFESRLSWHCHFIQKLEDEPRIEFENFNRAYDGLRPDVDFPAADGAEWDAAAFDAWREGQTGYPIIDASMRCLATTGWLNFRMRAMLV
ncbi:MAG: deoxyribodipyrimidine photo-lyase, partial [Planctomycetota bacterium]